MPPSECESRRGTGTIWQRWSTSTASLGKELRQTGTTHRHVAMGTGRAARQQRGGPSCSAVGSAGCPDPGGDGARRTRERCWGAAGVPERRGARAGQQHGLGQGTRRARWPQTPCLGQPHLRAASANAENSFPPRSTGTAIPAQGSAANAAPA